MKKTLSLFLVTILCLSLCLCAGAEEVQPRWKVLGIMSSELYNYNGIYNNAEVSASASCGYDTVRIDMVVTIVRWNGSAYVDTSTHWTDSGNGAAGVAKKFHLGEGNYKARTTVTLYDSDGTYIETVTAYSDDIVI